MELAKLLSLHKGALDQHLSFLEKGTLIKSDSWRRGRCEIAENGVRMLQILGITKDLFEASSNYGQMKKLAYSNLKKFRQIALGKREKWITVLGAFDTWPYMDYTSAILAELGFTVFTGRFNYRKINQIIISQDATPDLGRRMGDFLQEMIKQCRRAVIVYSVSAGHYVETDWCSRLRKETLGLVFVRDTIPPSDYCSDLIPDFERNFSICGCKGETSWNCIAKAQCPFKKQGISYNIIEYFLERNRMFLVAVSRMSDVKEVLQYWLESKLANKFR